MAMPLSDSRLSYAATPRGGLFGWLVICPGTGLLLLLPLSATKGRNYTMQ